MRDALGIALTNWRSRVVLTHVRGRLLDIGCGTNHLATVYGGEAIGVDVFQWRHVDLVVKDAAHLPFPDGCFDTVAIVAALNHMPNRADVLREAHRVLANDGRLIVTMIPPLVSRVWHALRSPWDRDQRERGMKEGEVYGLAPRAVRELLEAAGFRVSFERRFMLGFNRLTVAEKALE